MPSFPINLLARANHPSTISFQSLQYDPHHGRIDLASQLRLGAASRLSYWCMEHPHSGSETVVIPWPWGSSFGSRMARGGDGGGGGIDWWGERWTNRERLQTHLGIIHPLLCCLPHQTTTLLLARSFFGAKVG